MFVGHLTITGSGVVLDGRYAPPLGRVGLLIDQGLHRFLEELGHRSLAAVLASSGLGAVLPIASDPQ